MDIFTTQLTRVVPTTLKPTKFKVKALTKDTKSKALNEEEDHLSHDSDAHITIVRLHSYYNAQQYQVIEEETAPAETGQEKSSEAENSSSEEDKNKTTHLDIYI